jgi:endonuclease III
MATTINKQRLLNLLFAAGPKLARAGGDHPHRQAGKCTGALSRPVLEECVYGLCRENATREQADRAYRRLRERFFDFNEMRVSSVRELEEAFAGLTEPEARAQRLISLLQEVFETEFSFDLDKLQKLGLKQAAKQLTRYQAADEYLGAWVVQRCLGGHAIPLDAPTLRCARRLGMVDAGQEDPEAARASLEHLVPKAKGPLFTDLVSDLAEQVCREGEPDCPACPLNAECPTAQEAGAAVSAGRAHRAKPR